MNTKGVPFPRTSLIYDGTLMRGKPHWSLSQNCSIENGVMSFRFSLTTYKRIKETVIKTFLIFKDD